MSSQVSDSFVFVGNEKEKADFTLAKKSNLDIMLSVIKMSVYRILMMNKKSQLKLRLYMFLLKLTDPSIKLMFSWVDILKSNYKEVGSTLWM